MTPDAELLNAVEVAITGVFELCEQIVYRGEDFDQASIDQIRDRMLARIDSASTLAPRLHALVREREAAIFQP